ncbi:MAG: endolytic transglycosylase MltG, partial [Acutalibacteraceae bacterium]
AAASGGKNYATVSRSNNIRKPAQAPAPGRAQNAGQPVEKRQVRMRTTSAKSRFSTLVLFLAVVAVLTVTFTAMSMSAIGDILAINRSEEFVRVEIPADPDMNDVIDVLHDAGLIKQKFLCTMFAKYRHFDGYTDRDGNYQKVTYLSGIYDLEPKQGLEGMLNTVKESSGSGAETVSVTFPEGWTITQIFDRLEKKGVCSASKLYANIETVAKQYDFYYSIPKREARYLVVEGYLFPDTYEFYKNENAVSVLKKLFDNSDKKWKKKYESKAKKLGYTRDEILIIASIIQKEAANQSQMADISSVIHNRLKSSTYPNLQCDSTSDYITNHVKPHVDSSHAQIYAESYNTYKIEGLPPGPICNPGLDAIVAALNPNDTNYYFFCHNNKGKIYLSSTYDQFQKDSLKVINDNNGGGD